jgi:hypothetical protein
LNHAWLELIVAQTRAMPFNGDRRECGGMLRCGCSLQPRLC